MLKNDKVLIQRVGSGCGSFYGFCAFYKENYYTNRDQMLVKWAWQQHFRPPVTGKKAINSN